MTPSTLLALLAGNAKLTVAVAATAAATAGGGLAVASSVTAGNAHAATGLSHLTAGAPALPAAATEHAHGAVAGANGQGRSDVAPIGCDAATSHGQYVSSIARQHPDPSDPGAHGQAVAAAAQSDCGKPAGASADGSDTETPDTETPDTEAPDSGSGGAATPNSHSTSHPTGKPTSLPGHASTQAPSH
jgi:hypothetical protein